MATKILNFIKGEIVLTTAWVLGLLSMLAVPPDQAYPDYIDFHTLGLLFSLMAVMASLQGLGLFRRLGGALLARTRTTRQLEAVLILLPFFTSMLVTNDVALITFVPFGLEVLALAGRSSRAIPVVAMQTVAANLGSMATPIGNPQNLFLYSHYGLSFCSFFGTVLPFAALSLVLILLFLLVSRSQPLEAPALSEAPTTLPRGRVALLAVLFLLCLAAVAGLVPLWLVCAVTLIVLLATDRKALLGVDWCLLLTFVGFFIFVGNLGRVPVFTGFFQSILQGHETLCAVAISQVISNVPAALLLSGFTDSAEPLLIGVNLGGLGTLIASMASLISYKYIARSGAHKGRYLGWFTGANVVFLAVLLIFWVVLY